MANSSLSNSRCFSGNTEINISLGNICQSDMSIIKMNIEDISIANWKKSFLLKKMLLKRTFGKFQV